MARTVIIFNVASQSRLRNDDRSAVVSTVTIPMPCAMGYSFEGGLIMAIDPVCNMEVNEKEAAATSEYQGETYYFCAPGCKKEFDSNPEKYSKSK